MVYSLEFGIPDSMGRPHFIYGLEGDRARLLGVTAMEENVLYSTTTTAQQATLDVPVVQVESGGFVSGTFIRRDFESRGGVPANSPLDVLGEGDPAAFYATGTTFQTLIHDSFGVDWPTFQQQFDLENVYGINVVDHIYVYVPVIDDIQGVAQSIADAGLFDELHVESLRRLSRIAESVGGTRSVDSPGGVLRLCRLCSAEL